MKQQNIETDTDTEASLTRHGMHDVNASGAKNTQRSQP